MHDNYYGTSFQEIKRIQEELKRIPILDIDIKGAIQIYRNKKFGKANYLFI